MQGSEQLATLIRQWGELWGVPELHESVTVEFTTRLTATLGRCTPATGRVRLAARLLEEPTDLLHETLCHEVAHVAVHRLYGPEVKPHGHAWSHLVSAAGFNPRVTAPSALRTKVDHDPADRAAVVPSGRFRYEHRCPVCHTVRYAQRPVPSWRCATCLETGLTGAMVIAEVAHEDDEP